MIKESIYKLLKLDNFLDHISGYFEARVDLLKIEIKEDVSRLLAKIFLILAAGLFLSLFVLLLSFGVAFYLGSIMGSLWGFLVVAGIYLLFGLVIILFRKPIHAKLEKYLLEIAQTKSSNHGTNGSE